MEFLLQMALSLLPKWWGEVQGDGKGHRTNVQRHRPYSENEMKMTETERQDRWGDREIKTGKNTDRHTEKKRHKKKREIVQR